MTPPLDKGIILPGVTRRSILVNIVIIVHFLMGNHLFLIRKIQELTEQWGEFEVSERTICMEELVTANSEGTLLEVFGSGTAAVVTPVGAIHYQGRKVELPTPSDGLAIRWVSVILWGHNSVWQER